MFINHFDGTSPCIRENGASVFHTDCLFLHYVAWNEWVHFPARSTQHFSALLKVNFIETWNWTSSIEFHLLLRLVASDKAFSILNLNVAQCAIVW